MNKLYISAEFDGANPGANGIVRMDNNHFVLNAFSETTLESFRMETMIINDYRKEQLFHIEINWPTADFSELRDCFYWKHDKMSDWITIPAGTASGKSFITSRIPPGRGFLCLHPHYGYDDCERFLTSRPDNGFIRQEVAGKTEKGRNIRLVKISDNTKDDKKLRFLICARNHANESSGNYCIEGMIEWLLSDDPVVPYFLQKIDFFFLPMTNPDGVTDGMARFTGTRCTDLNRTAEWLHENTPAALPDKSHEVFFNVIDSVQPSHFINLHSYLFKYKDEIYAYSEKDIECFARFFPDDINAGKVWKHTILKENRSFPTCYSKNKFGTQSFLFEIPWFGRNAVSMKETGKKIIRTVILMNTVKDNSWGDIK